jgi:hypothetical protein
VRLAFRPVELLPNGWFSSSRPSRKDLFRLHNLFRRTGEAALVFSSPAGNKDLDGVQAAVLHLQAELFVDFLEAVLTEAFAHAHTGASVCANPMAMLIPGSFGTEDSAVPWLNVAPEALELPKGSKSRMELSLV